MQNSNSPISIVPVIKWAGGKRQLLPAIKSMLPETFHNYYEPFIGGGAVFLDLQPKRATINDTNIQLINLYTQLRTSFPALTTELTVIEDEYNSKMQLDDKKAMYLALRNEFNLSIINTENTVRSAALLIFLNKTCFNGLYRTNKAGAFNVAFGKKDQIHLFDRKNLEAVSSTLSHTAIACGDFEPACCNADEGDFVFFDSPYHETFNKYQAGGFEEADHVRLAALFKALTEKGVFCMLTNSNTEFIRALYSEYNIRTVPVRRMINRDASGRTGEEIIVTNYPCEN